MTVVESCSSMIAGPKMRALADSLYLSYTGVSVQPEAARDALPAPERGAAAFAPTADTASGPAAEAAKKTLRAPFSAAFGSRPDFDTSRSFGFEILPTAVTRRLTISVGSVVTLNP